MEKFYLMYYFLVRKDSSFPKKERVHFVIETVFFMITGSITMMLCGWFNIRNMTILLLIVTVIPLVVSRSIVKYGIEKTNLDLKFIKNGKSYSNKNRKLLIILGILSLPLVFSIMFCGGVMMSYLWSLH